MRYAFTLDGRTHHVTLEEHADGPRFVVEGEAFTPDVKSTGKGTYEVTLDGSTFEFHIHNGIVSMGPHPLDLEVRRAKPELVRAGGAGKRGEGRIKPPMPGKVVEVHVKVGQEVAEGEVLLVLEAMKMQNDVKSPIAGIVEKVHVQDGANVDAATVMLEIAPESRQE